MLKIMFRREIYTEIDIHAPSEIVWKLLTDFSNFPDWNPFIRSATGEAKPGANLEINLQLSDSRSMKFRPAVIKAEQNHELRWLGHLWVRGLFDGEHIFTIEAIGSNRVHFIQRELLDGLLVPIFTHVFEKDTTKGFEKMNHALKDMAEKDAHVI